MQRTEQQDNSYTVAQFLDIRTLSTIRQGVVSGIWRIGLHGQMECSFMYQND